MPDWVDDTYDFPHELTLGDTYRPLVKAQLLDSTGTAYDMTGVTGVCRIRSEAGGVGTVLISPTVTVDAADKSFYWSATAAEVLAATGLTRARRAHLYLRLTWPSGHKKTVIAGCIEIKPNGAA